VPGRFGIAPVIPSDQPCDRLPIADDDHRITRFGTVDQFVKPDPGILKIDAAHDHPRLTSTATSLTGRLN
jgi:hypothetical protein